MQDILTCGFCLFSTIILLVIANGMPVLLRKILEHRLSWPIDFGLLFYDKRPFLGQSKTWRGLFAAVFATSLIAPLLGIPLYTGALFAALVMCGDLSASFIKRRLGYIESSRFRMLDILPESLLPVLILQEDLELSLPEGIIAVAIFFIFEVLVSPVLFRLHIRKRPY